MRACSVAALAALAATAGFAGVSASALGAGKARACSPKGSTTVFKTRSARVFDLDGNVYGCLLSVGRRRLLDQDDGVYSAVQPVAAGGRYVAWGYNEIPACKASCPPGTTGVKYVGVIDLKSGRRRTTAGSPIGVAVTRFGGLAWIDGATSRTTVMGWDGAGKRVLDPGPVEGRLRLFGSIVLWRSGGRGHWEELRR